MPNQEITVGLRFTADTAAARQQLNTLKQDLNNLGTLNNINFGSGLSKSILEASSAAAKLKVQLEEATNVKTGNLDLTKFSFNLKQSGMTLEQYKKQLFALGPEGEKAFFQLANSIQQAEIPMLRINKLAANLWDSLKRTTKWQISSSAIHAVMGAVQSAYGYAKDLNESLNNIRIVTGQSSEQMAKFAQNANKAAKALSTTTTAYTDAALIYYQQGLNDQEVLARTDTTVKMANVTRQSAETVSDQMTAVWNNFAKGNENLESFADKMVALGAATASSSDEIAQGLEKFAGVADTIGLSFDYAAAALTTITATTRMSADTVGTALKTLFSRLESLKLGDSLEDGTDLTKYSKALAKVGVNIKDANGEIKEMDTILDETMAKWQTLDKASQIALAQTVAGQRQYTHFMTLMSQSDFFKENLRTQANSMGALQKQADIYAESWEAADKRVKASMEAIYQDILNDDFFIKLTSGFADVLEKVDQFIKALGGLQGILPGIAALILKIGGDKIALNLERSAYGLKNLITQGSDARKLQTEAGNISFKELESSDSLIDQSLAAKYEAINKSQYALNTNAKKLSDIDLKHFQILLDKVRVMHEIATEKAKESENADKIVESDKKSLKNLIEREKRNRNQEKQQYINEQKTNIEKQFGPANYSKTNGKSYRDNLIAEIKNSGGEEILNSIKLSNFHGKGAYERYINALIEALANLKAEAAATEPEVQRLFEAPPSIQEAIQFYTDESEILDEVIVAEQQYKKVLDETKDDDSSDAINKRKEALNNYKQALINTGASDDEFNQGLKEINKALKNNNGILDENIKAHNLLSVAYADHENGLSSLRETLIQYGLDEEKVDAALDKLRIDINDSVEKARKFEQAAREGEETTEDFTKRIQEASSAQYSWSQAIVQGAQTLSSLMMSLNSLKGAFDTLKNPDMSTWDKFTSIMTSLSFALPGIISSITTLKTVFEGLTIVGKAYNATQTFQLGQQVLLAAGIDNVTKKQNKETQELINYNAALIINEGLKAIAIEQSKLNKDSTEEERKEIEKNTKEIKKNTEAKLENMLADTVKKRTGKDLSPEDAKNFAKNAFEDAEKGLNNSKGINNLFSGIEAKFKNTTTKIKTGITDLAKKFGVEVPKMLGSFGLIALGVAAIGTAVYASIKLYNKDAEAAQKAANAAKIAGDAAQEAADKYNTLKDTIDKYDSIKDGLGELVTGTQAFKDAITEANAEALKLIQTLPGLQYTYDKNGLIQINPEDLEDAQSKAAAQANLSQSNSLIMQAQASEAQRKSTNTNFQRDVLKGTASDFWEDVGNIVTATLTGAGSGAAIGAGVGGLTGTAVLPLFGSLAGMAGGAASGILIGGIAGLATGITGAIATGNSNKNEQEGLDAVAAYYKKNPDLFAKFGVGTANYDEQGFADALKNIEGVTDDVARVMARNAEQLQEHIDTQSQVIEQERALLKEALNIRNMNNEDYSESDYKDFILAQQAKDIDSQSEQYQNKRKEIKDMLSGSDKDLAEEYLRYAFGDEADNYRIRNKGGTNWTVQKKNDSGSWETQGDKNSLSQEDVIDFITKQKLLEESDKALGNYLKTAEEYGGQLERFGFSIAEAQKASMTQSEIEEEEARMANIRDEILTAAAEERAADLTSLTFKEIRELREKSTATLDEYYKGTLDEALQAAEDAKRVANLNASASWNTNSEQREKEDLQKTLETVEMTEEAFDAYAESLQKVNSKSGMTVEMSRQIAKETIKTSAAIRDISTILDDNAKVLEELTSNQDDYVNGNKQLTAEQASVIGELKKALGDWLDADFSFDEVLQNMDKIKAAAENDAEAIRQLGYLAAQKTVMELDIDETSKNEFYNFINYIDGLDQDLTIGATLDMIGKEDFINDINEMILTGQVAAEDIAKAMKQIGIELTPIDEKWVEAGSAKGSLKLSVLGMPLSALEYETVNYAKVPVYDTSSFKYTGGGQTTTLPALKSSSGSSGESKKDTTPKKVSEEIDRYHEVNAEIDDLTKKMDELSTLKDRAWGGRRIAAIRAEQQALKEYGELLQRKSNEAYEYLQQDASYLNAYGAIYDEDGRLLNSNEIIAQAVSDFNVGSIDDEKFNDIKEYISNYEDSLEEYQDSLYAIAENLRNEFDKEIEEITATIDVKLNIDDRQIKYIEWLVGHLEDKAFSQAAIISTASQNYDNILNKWDAYTTGIHDILAKVGASEEDITNYLNGNVDALLELDNIDEVKDELEEYTDGLADTYDQLKDLKDLIEQQLSSVYDEWNDKIEYQISLMEHYDSILGHYKNIVDILGLDFLGLSTKNLIDLSQAQINSSVSMVQTLKARWNAAQEELKTAQTNLQNATSEADQKFWTEEIEKLTQASNKLEENFYSSWEDILNKISDLFDTTRERIFKDFEKSISDTFDSFDEMSSLLDQKKTLATEYVPEYKKIYELNKLNRNLAKEIDKINNVSKTKKLKDLQDEINVKMREGVQLSEYDLEYMQKKYDLRLAEIALEDAQAAKTTVRLQRDSSGNYSYVYTTNEEETNDKLQDYEDKLYTLQDTTENYFNTLSESYFQIMQDWENALSSLDKNDKNYEQKVDKINTFYQKRMQYITSEINKGLKNNQQLYKDDQEYMNIYYTNQENRQRAFVLDFKDTLVGGILDGFNSIDEATNYITGQMNNTLDQLSIAWTDYYNQTEEALQLNGMSFEDFSGKLEDIIFGENGINAKISSIAETTQEMAGFAKEDYNKAASAIESFQQRVGPKLDELFQKTQDYTTAHLDLIDALKTKFDDPMNTSTNITITDNVTAAEAKSKYGIDVENNGNINNNNNNNLSNLLTMPLNFINTTKDILDSVKKVYRPYDDEKHLVIIQGKNVRKSYYEKHQFDKTANSTIKYVKCDLCGQQIKNPNFSSLDSLLYNILPSSQLNTPNDPRYNIPGKDPTKIHFKTGGYVGKLKQSNNSIIISGATGMRVPSSRYTGDWGADGRLAILHEKELVLNRQDTENMLSAVNVIRNLSSTLNLPDLASKMNYLPSQISSSYFKDLSKNQEITQEVHIDASFPGVTAREEIEQAFGELALQASQYINKYETQY